ncbi:unnamed protein product [Dicrocoelium dendriticum]|nr:unnamed protein product [Dicrocoelium dendriticum]
MHPLISRLVVVMYLILSTYCSPFNHTNWGDYFNFHINSNTKISYLDTVKEMFHFAYSNYMNHSFPFDELDPIHCVGRGYDYANPANINVNDALGDFHLTLIDSLDSLAIMGLTDDFKHAVNLAISHLSFDRNVRVQVFEATIRVLGGLLSAHLMITDPAKPFGDIYPIGYSGELLALAHDLANRMLNVFDWPQGQHYFRDMPCRRWFSTS